MMKFDNTQTKVIDEVVEERIKQDKKWGRQEHNGYKWLSILVEEVGEVSQELNQEGDYSFKDVEKELTQVAAVAVAWLEHLKKQQNRGEE